MKSKSCQNKAIIDKIAIILFAFIILSIAVPSGLAESYGLASSIDMKLNISSFFDVSYMSKSAKIKNVKVELSYYPKSSNHQDVLSLDAFPNAEEKGSKLYFFWPEAKQGRHEFGYIASLKSYYSIDKITKKAVFPVTGLSREMNSYLMQTDSVDFMDKDIIALANELSAGETDLFVVVHKFASWVNKNIAYDLNSATASASKPASWVIENKEGVCDELTNLFIALCRAVGIPARFVSGLAYTNIKTFRQPWSPHGWAEVYFPGYGWVSFDVTYGELGYLDAGHIKLKDDVDANRSSTEYSWEAYKAKLTTHQLRTDVDVSKAYSPVQPLLDINASVAKSKIGFNSYNVIIADIENKNDFYVSTELTLSRTSEIEVFNDYNRLILLGPKSRKRVFWMIRLKDVLDGSYSYTFPVSITTSRNKSSETSFSSAADFPVYGLSEMRSFIEGNSEASKKSYSKNISISCTTKKSQYFTAESPVVSCKLSNNGNLQLSNVEVCLRENSKNKEIKEICKKQSLSIAEKKNISFKLKFSTIGMKDITVSAKAGKIIEKDSIMFDVVDVPVLSIADISYPKEVKLEQPFKIAFTLVSDSKAKPRSILVSISSKSFEKQWFIKSMDTNRKFIINIAENSLSAVNNTFTIRLNYKDDLDRKYSVEKSFVIKVIKPTIKDRAILFLNSLNENTLYLIGAAFLSFIITILIIKIVFSNKESVL